jgi:hypothetical protein
MAKSKPSGHTSSKIDHIAGKMMHSPKPEARQVAAAALSDTHMAAHTRAAIASVAGGLMHTGNKQERRVAASVLSDHRTKKK